MALQKFSSLKLGKGPLVQLFAESQIFVEQRAPQSGSIQGITDWNIATPYSYQQPVRYQGSYYRSNIIGTNLGNTPTVTGWDLVDGKDGDVWIQVPNGTIYSNNSAAVGLFQKVNGTWVPLSASTAFAVKLLDGTSGTAFTYGALLLPYANFTYTIRRQAYPETIPNYSQVKQGSLIVQNDGTNIIYSHEYQELGNDVACILTPVISGVNVQIQYAATTQGQDIEFRFNLSGWATGSL